jgi:hypothetical protein
MQNQDWAQGKGEYEYLIVKEGDRFQTPQVQVENIVDDIAEMLEDKKYTKETKEIMVALLSKLGEVIW